MRAFALALAALVGGRAVRLTAQEPAPLVLRVPPSPRALGLGNAYVGGDGADAIFFNPANVARSPGLFASVGRYRDASTSAAIASSTTFGSKLALSAFATWLDYGADGFLARPTDLTLRGPDGAENFTAGVGLATIVRKVRLGAAVKYGEERIGGVRGGRAIFDVGISREIDWLTAGISVQNLGGDLDVGGAKRPLPTRVTAGATTRRLAIGAQVDVLLSGAVSREQDGTIVPAGGGELVYEPVSGWTAKLRAGIRRTSPITPEIRPFTAGASLGLDRFSLDYGMEWYRSTGVVHHLGIRIE
jgi:hypothetical protein